MLLSRTAICLGCFRARDTATVIEGPSTPRRAPLQRQQASAGPIPRRSAELFVGTLTCVPTTPGSRIVQRRGLGVVHGQRSGDQPAFLTGKVTGRQISPPHRTLIHEAHVKRAHPTAPRHSCCGAGDVRRPLACRGLSTLTAENKYSIPLPAERTFEADGTIGLAAKSVVLTARTPAGGRGTGLFR